MGSVLEQHAGLIFVGQQVASAAKPAEGVVMEKLRHAGMILRLRGQPRWISVLASLEGTSPSLVQKKGGPFDHLRTGWGAAGARSMLRIRRSVALPDVLQRLGQRLLSDGAIDVHGVAGEDELVVIALVGQHARHSFIR